MTALAFGREKIDSGAVCILHEWILKCDVSMLVVA